MWPLAGQRFLHKVDHLVGDGRTAADHIPPRLRHRRCLIWRDQPVHGGAKRCGIIHDPRGPFGSQPGIKRQIPPDFRPVQHSRSQGRGLERVTATAAVDQGVAQKGHRGQPVEQADLCRIIGDHHLGRGVGIARVAPSQHPKVLILHPLRENIGLLGVGGREDQQQPV